MRKNTLLWKLFTIMLYISTFTFGGGFVIVSLMKSKLVDELHWIDEQEMLDLAAIAQSTPGAIAVNGAILVGYRVAGILGVIVSVIGTILPPMIVLSIISVFYELFATNPYVSLVLKGMQAGVAAMILDVVLGLGSTILKTRSWVYYSIMIGAFIATFFYKVNVVYIILTSTLIGICLVIYKQRVGVEHV
ncbi:MAG: chromate transporter [Erysipelotrichales bacterium]|nr:chromate transporter [Erysipelotrichales bacterium]MBR3693631.1 chromate transporter [Erysipelotrichales bacterium]